ncbi:MAG: radical SAM protein [Pseudomonadota bacterium]
MSKFFINANFHQLSPSSVHGSSDAAYREYRRKWDTYPSERIVADFPLHLDIETTCRCNLRCVFCDKQPLLPGGESDLPESVFRKVVDEGSEHGLCSIKLSYRGEPLLYPKLASLVHYAKKKGVLDVYFNTNGMLLTQAKAVQLVEAGLNRISVSIEGTDAKQYEAQRVGASFDKVRANIEALVKVRERLGVDYPKIRIQTVALPWVDLERYSAFWGEIADEVACLDFNDSLNRTCELVDENFCCPQIWQRMTITCEGTILACNNDDYQRSAMGSVYDSSIRECWLGGRVRAMRQAHAEGRSHAPPSCSDCAWRTTQIRKSRQG